MVYTLPFFSLQNAVCFIILTHLVPVLFTFYIQGVLKLKQNNSGAKRLKTALRGKPQGRQIAKRTGRPIYFTQDISHMQLTTAECKQR